MWGLQRVGGTTDYLSWWKNLQFQIQNYRSRSSRKMDVQNYLLSEDFPFD